jgi:para-nitrobenzyl esterase
MILGSNSDEAQHMIRSVLPGSEYRERAQKDYGADAGLFETLYPGNSDQAAKISQQQEMADSSAMMQRGLAGDIAQDGATAFLYYFAYLDTGGYNSETPTLGLKLGADHGAELPYVFGLMNHWLAPVPEGDIIMQNIVMSYWIDFAKTMDPNGPGLPAWKPFSKSDKDIMVLDERVGMQPHPREEQLEFLQFHPLMR